MIESTQRTNGWQRALWRVAWGVLATGVLGYLIVQRRMEITAAERYEGVTLDDAVAELRASVGHDRREGQLARLASLGERARPAGELVVTFLDDADWDVRVSAVQALGQIRHRPAVEVLQKALGSTDDWRLVYVAAEALVRLRAKSALPKLDRIAREHWFPPVRERARNAARAMRGSQRFVVPRYDAFGVKAFPYKKPELPADFFQDQGNLGRRQLENFEAAVGLPIGQSFLLGTNNGEWGGQLSFLDERGQRRVFLSENIVGIHRMAEGVVVVGGLAHLSMNNGRLYRVTMREGALPVARLWKTLPGAPVVSGVMEDGSLFVSCLGGDVVVAADGDMRMANAGSARPSTTSGP